MGNSLHTYEKASKEIYKLIISVRYVDFTKIFDHDALNLCIFKYSYTIKKLLD